MAHGSTIKVRTIRGLLARQKTGKIVEILDQSPNITRMIKSCDRAGNSLLILAAEMNNVVVCRILLRKGANPNAKNSQGKTALMTVIERGHLALVDVLMQHGSMISHAELDSVEKQIAPRKLDPAVMQQLYENGFSSAQTAKEMQQHYEKMLQKCDAWDKFWFDFRQSKRSRNSRSSRNLTTMSKQLRAASSKIHEHPQSSATNQIISCVRCAKTEFIHNTSSPKSRTTRHNQTELLWNKPLREHSVSLRKLKHGIEDVFKDVSNGDKMQSQTPAFLLPSASCSKLDKFEVGSVSGGESSLRSVKSTTNLHDRISMDNGPTTRQVVARWIKFDRILEDMLKDMGQLPPLKKKKRCFSRGLTLERTKSVRMSITSTIDQ